MSAESRRAEILRLLKKASRPVSASKIAEKMSVSRQIIVGDIALLRAGGAQIASTPRGYVIPADDRQAYVRQVATEHDASGTQAELNAIVDHGCTVVDVIVEHPLYGELKGALQISSRYDVEQFIRKCLESEAMPLSQLTNGVHLHTLSCPDEAAFRRAEEALRKLGFLVQD